MTCRAFFKTLLSIPVLLLIVGCAEMEPSASVAPAPQLPPPGYWNGDGVPGEPKIVVSIAEQRAYFFKGKNLVGETTVSTGKPGFGTPPGHYTVLSKDAAHVSTVFGDYVDDAGNVVKSNIDSRKDARPKGSHYDGARMPFAMFFRSGYAMHQGYVPPYAASHGCIRVPRGMAETFFNAASVGTPVIVKQEAVMHTAPAPVPALTPAVTTLAPPPPNLVRSNPPGTVPPAPTRSTVLAPTPALRRKNIPAPTPTPVVRLTNAPAPTPARVVLRTPSPAPVRSNVVRSNVVPAPSPLRSPAPVVRRMSVPMTSPTPVALHTPTAIPVRSPAPRPLRSPAPVPLRSPAPNPVRPSTAAVISPTPSPSRSRTQGKVRSRHHRHSQSQTPAPSPAPSPAQ